MKEERKFPLIVWESTQEFKKEYEGANTRFNELVKKLTSNDFKCTHIGSLRFNIDAYPEIWINPSTPYYRKLSSKDAIEVAKKYGSCGWYNLDELEQFTEGKGIIFDEAMFRLGFRRHKKSHEVWVKREKDIQRAPILINDGFEAVYESELDKLTKLIVMPNGEYNMNSTFEIRSGNRGMLFIGLIVNPFTALSTEQLSYQAGLEAQRGHLTKQQSGFCIEPKNIKINDQRYVYLKCTKDESSITEFLWPHYLPKDRLFEIADDLVSRVNLTSSISQR